MKSLHDRYTNHLLNKLGYQSMVSLDHVEKSRLGKTVDSMDKNLRLVAMYARQALHCPTTLEVALAQRVYQENLREVQDVEIKATGDPEHDATLVELLQDEQFNLREVSGAAEYLNNLRAFAKESAGALEDLNLEMENRVELYGELLSQMGIISPAKIREYRKDNAGIREVMKSANWLLKQL